MPDQLVFSAGVKKQLDFRMKLHDVLALRDAFVESQPNAGYIVHAGDNLNSWHDGSPQLSFNYDLIVMETINYWDSVFKELLPGSSLTISLDTFDSLNNWTDFIPSFTMTYGMAMQETLALVDFVSMSQLIQVLIENEIDALAIADLLDLGYGIEL